MHYLHKYLRLLKDWRVEKLVGVSLAFLILFGGGFLGINNFKVDERFVDLTDQEGNELSMDTLGNSAIEETEKVEASDTNSMTVNAKSAVLMDAGTGRVLFSQNENDELPPASVTKIMTMLLVLEAVDSGRVSLEDKVIISANAASMGGSQMYMEQGEEHTLDEIMKGVAMVSANDGCVAAAEYLSGSVEIFVENMNKRGSELGMKHTQFKNTNGLPAEGHYSSALDIAVMSRELLKHTEGRTWFTTWQDKINVGLPGKQTEFGLTNTNKLIKQYQGAIGIKTGFTSEAGYCLSGAATRDDTTLIAVVMGCETTDIRLKEITKLLDYGFASYETALIYDKGDVATEAEIEKGKPDTIKAVAKEKISLLVRKGEKENVTCETFIDDNISAPLKKGDRVGEVLVLNNGKEAGRYELVAEDDVEKAGFFDIYARLMKNII